MVSPNPVAVRIRVHEDHYLTYSPYGIQDDPRLRRRLTDSEWDFLSSLADEESGAVVVATVAGKTVGWFRYTNMGWFLCAQGTWVREDFRRRGIARGLWIAAIEAVCPERFHADVVSEGGRGLLDSLHRDGWLPLPLSAP